jgi:AcrR family transcriptional regulator
MSEVRKSQAERRAATREALLESACRLFGEKGYRQTSLEEIAEDCRLTIRPIYYHFGNKKALFAAVSDIMEERASKVMREAPAQSKWESFLDICRQPSYRRILLSDGPSVLGREYWIRHLALPWQDPGNWRGARAVTDDNLRREFRNRMALAALNEAAMAVMESGDTPFARQEAGRLVELLASESDSTGQERAPLLRLR